MIDTNYLGIIGGLGPLATADFLTKLARNTPAYIDQDHIPILVYGDCTVPDRTACIINKKESPLPKILEGIQFLNQAGVGLICFPCNSSHKWFEEIEVASKVPVLNIVKASIAHIRHKNLKARTIGVLSTQGTYHAGVYTKYLKKDGYFVEHPTKTEFDDLVSPGIALVKSNNLKKAEGLFLKATDNLIKRGAEAIILGCTEIPIVLQKHYDEIPTTFIDSSEALAMEVIKYFRKNTLGSFLETQKVS